MLFDLKLAVFPQYKMIECNIQIAKESFIEDFYWNEFKIVVHAIDQALRLREVSWLSEVTW